MIIKELMAKLSQFDENLPIYFTVGKSGLYLSKEKYINISCKDCIDISTNKCNDYTSNYNIPYKTLNIQLDFSPWELISCKERKKLK